MKNFLFLFFLFSISNGFSQSLEEDIYAATESFYNKQNAQSLETLNLDIIRFEPLLKTEDEYFAFIR